VLRWIVVDPLVFFYARLVPCSMVCGFSLVVARFEGVSGFLRCKGSDAI
jgi:hypothetical protein